MYLLSKDGSKHLLEFLRNLTPQVLLLSSAFILFAIWDRSSNAHIYLILFVGIVAMCILAIVANMNNFLDNAFSHSADIAAERDRLKGESIHGARRIRFIVKYIWTDKRGTFIELLVVLGLIYGAIFAILVASVASALKAMS
ncbi:MAG: hypothetical protein ABIP44_11710 [Pseudoxanthomonas sp.]